MTAANFKLLCGVLPEPMLLVSPTGGILAANAAAATLLKQTPADLAGTMLVDLATDPVEKVNDLLSLFSRSGAFMPGALTMRCGGETLACRIEGALLRTDERTLLLRLQPQKEAVRQFRVLDERIARLNREIFDRKQAVTAAALLSAIVDSSDDAIISKDLRGVITSWNYGAERLFGYGAAEAIGKSIALIIPPERLEEEPKILERIARGERLEHFETIRMRKDGIRVDISLTISPVKDLDGHIIGASKIARDITARVRQERDLRDANEALKRANADLEQFAYSVSHDLQEPLRMVSTYSELLRRRFGGQLGESGDQYIRFAVEGAARMDSLLQGLGTYIHVSTEECTAQEEIDANEVLQSTLATLDILVKENGAIVTSTALPRVRMYPFQLGQVLQNLITNAIRYRGQESPNIRIDARLQGKEWVFSVKDNGIGIDTKFKEHIFGIFKRLHNTTEYPGTGIGLAICKRVVERCGGRIWVDSEPERGATFYFTIPRQPSTGHPTVVDTAG